MSHVVVQCVAPEPFPLCLLCLIDNALPRGVYTLADVRCRTCLAPLGKPLPKAARSPFRSLFKCESRGLF